MGKFVFSDFLNLFLFDSKNQIAGVVRALQDKGLFQSLAEPNLIAEDGKEASFLAGGEYPYPVVQGQSGGTSITIQFKEFGIRLNFVAEHRRDDLVKLKVRPEVSSLDFANAVMLQGFRVPAITTRRTETEVELQDGQTFAVAGLMNNTLTTQMSKIPGIGDIPILGLSLPQQGGAQGQHRARGDDHADHPAPQFDGRVLDGSQHDRAVHAAAEQDAAAARALEP